MHGDPLTDRPGGPVDGRDGSPCGDSALETVVVPRADHSWEGADNERGHAR